MVVFSVPLGWLPMDLGSRCAYQRPHSDEGCILRCPFLPCPHLAPIQLSIYIKKQVLRVTILEAEGIRNVAVLKKTDSYVAAELVTTGGKRESRTSVKKVREGEARSLI